MDTYLVLVWFTKFLVISIVCWRTKAVQSDTCWDGANAEDYTGTVAVTPSGRTCQHWLSDSPHVHTFHGNAVFSYDGNDTAALNYCRDPDGTASKPFCYTMDPSVRFEYCNIPECYNLPCTANGVTGQSNPESFTTFLDTYTGINYLQREDSPYGFTCCGTIRQWRVYIRNSGTIRFQVWRKDNATGDYVLRGEDVFSYAPGDINNRHNEVIPKTERKTVMQGDLMGWYTGGQDMVAFSIGSTVQVALLATGQPSVGDAVDFSSAAIGNTRDYAIGAQVIPSLPPFFVNTVPSINVSESESVGNTVYSLTVSDDDVDDRATLEVSVASNVYFDLIGTDVIVKSSLDSGTQKLVFTVKDGCSQIGFHDLYVIIFPEPVTLTSLPVTANVSESETNETLIHTLTITPAGTYTCTLDSYDPIRPEGNPFIVKNTPTLDIGIYLKDAANISYNVATSYNVTVTCTNADPSSDTSYIIIAVDPNSQPVFASFQSSLTIDATAVNISDIVYTATVTDDEGDPITMSLICDPPSCPFAINNVGEIAVTSDPNLWTQNTYTFILTAYDGFNTVTSSNVSVTITDINVAPNITNLPAPMQTVLENQPTGTLVFQVLQSDGNGDAPTFYATFNSTACAGMYGIDSTDGRITTLAPLDYETDTPCLLTITVSDGVATSDPETLTIDVGDEDEPPIFSSNAYVISTEEVADGTALPDVGISATDPEGTAVSLSLNCSYVDIDSVSGIVTMTTNYDIETSTENPYTIACKVPATDATGQTSIATLNVIVSDGNDNAPEFEPPAYTFYIAEGLTGYGIVGTVTATDDDRTAPNNVITYTMTPTTSFIIGAGSGNIQNPVDLSAVTAGTTYSLTVTATDGGTPPLSNDITVIISVLTTTTAVTTDATDTSDDDGLFSNTKDIVLFALLLFAAILLLALLALLTWWLCCKKRFMGNKSQLTRITPKENNLRDYPKHADNSHAKWQSPETRKPPVGSERPDSEGSFISVSSIPNRVSAVQSVRRTTGLSDALDSPKPNNLENQTHVSLLPKQASATESIKRTGNLSANVDSQGYFRKPSPPKPGLEGNCNISELAIPKPKQMSAVESVKRMNGFCDAADSPRSVSNLAVYISSK